MIKQLAHVCFFSDNPEALLSFYQDVMEFPIRFDMKLIDGRPFGWYLDTGNRTFVEIFDQRGAVSQWGGEVVALKENANNRYKHLCFEVESLESFRQSLLDKGIDVGPITKGIDNSFQCWTKDPDGNTIELMEYTADSMQFK